MSTCCHNVFVYGTLMRGELRERCWPHQPLCVIPACVRGLLYDLGTTRRLLVAMIAWRENSGALRPITLM